MPDDLHPEQQNEDVDLRDQLQELREENAELRVDVDALLTAYRAVSRHADALDAKIKALEDEIDPPARRRLWIVPPVAAAILTLPLKLGSRKPGKTAAALVAAGLTASGLAYMIQDSPEPGSRPPVASVPRGPYKPPRSMPKIPIPIPIPEPAPGTGEHVPKIRPASDKDSDKGTGRQVADGRGEMMDTPPAAPDPDPSPPRREPREPKSGRLISTELCLVGTCVRLEI